MLEAQVDGLVLSGSGIVIRDEGVSQGSATTINFVGPTIQVNVTGSIANIYANT
jgi:hypothetical protein